MGVQIENDSVELAEEPVNLSPVAVEFAPEFSMGHTILGSDASAPRQR